MKNPSDQKYRIKKCQIKWRRDRSQDTAQPAAVPVNIAHLPFISAKTIKIEQCLETQRADITTGRCAGPPFPRRFPRRPQRDQPLRWGRFPDLARIPHVKHTANDRTDAALRLPVSHRFGSGCMIVRQVPCSGRHDAWHMGFATPRRRVNSKRAVCLTLSKLQLKSLFSPRQD
jgi:hypothetical protein